MKNFSRIMKFGYPTTIGILATYSLYQYHQQKYLKQHINELTLDSYAAQIFLYKQFISFPHSYIFLPSGKRVPISTNDYKNFQISNQWNNKLANYVVNHINCFQLTAKSNIVVFNTSSFGYTAIMLAEQLKEKGITIFYLDTNNTVIELMKKYCCDDYPMLKPVYIDFNYFIENKKLDNNSLNVIKKSDLTIVQGPWTALNSSIPVDRGLYQQTAYASFFYTQYYSQFKIELMKACLSAGSTVIETTHGLIYQRMLNQTSLNNHSHNSKFESIATSKFIPQKQDGVLIHTPKPF